MTEKTDRFIATCVHVSRTGSIMSVGFANDDSNPTRYILLQLDTSPSAQDIILKHDRVHVEIDDQLHAGYGGIENLTLSGREVSVVFTAEAAAQMSTARSILVSIVDPDVDLDRLADTLTEMLPSSPHDTPIRVFWEWFREHASQLALESDDVVADRLHSALTSIDDIISVEVASEPAGDGLTREVIISALGDEAVAEKVRSIVSAAPKTAAWRFVALKPSRGFDFVFRAEVGEINASVLSFDPLESRPTSGTLGILLYCPDVIVNCRDPESLAMLIVETGVGEEKARLIETIRVAPERDRPAEALPIAELESYIDWHFRNAKERPPGLQ